MRILIVNKFFYPRGGDCIVAIATRSMLEERGHTVRVFAMDYPENTPLPESTSFASRVEFGGGIKDIVRGAARVLGMGDICTRFEKAIDDFRPDVVHLHNIHSYLSPVVAAVASRKGIRVVWTLHDYKLLCPAYVCRRPDASNCEACFSSKLGVITHRCMKGSLSKSLLACIEAMIWNRDTLQKHTDLFIAPSRFLHNKMLEGGFMQSKLTNICNFIDPARLSAMGDKVPASGKGYFCYIGRLSEEKGVETMLKAAAEADVRLIVAGTGPLENSLRNRYARNSNISFAGHLDAAGVANLLNGAEASVIPSEWYENNPLGVIESLCAGTPVIGSDIGGIPELISPCNGVTFTPGNTEELTAILAGFGKRNAFDRAAMAADARDAFGIEKHYTRLMKAYAGEKSNYN